MLRLARLFFPLALLVGCGGADDSTPSSTPLGGTIEKHAFAAKGAIALTGMEPSSKFVVIRDTEPSCDDLSAASDGDLLVTLEVPWKDGFTASLGSADVTVILESAPDKFIAVDGQVDVLHAPIDLGAKGQLRLLADALDDASRVDGQVDVVICQ